MYGRATTSVNAYERKHATSGVADQYCMSVMEMKNVTRRIGVLCAIVTICGTCLASLTQAQTAPTPAPTPTTSRIAITAALARAVIQKYFPSVLSDTTDPGTLFVIVGRNGELVNATHGTIEDNDKLKATYEAFDERVASIEIKSVPAGMLLRRDLTVVITTFKQ